MRLATVSPIWKMGRLDIILLGVPWGCKGLWFIELSCECFLPIKPESVLPAPRGSWAGGLEPERQVGGQSWLLDSCCRLSWACQLAWPRPHSQPLGFPSSWPSPVTAQPSLCSLGTIPTRPVFLHCPPLTFWCGRILDTRQGSNASTTPFWLCDLRQASYSLCAACVFFSAKRVQ